MRPYSKLFAALFLFQTLPVSAGFFPENAFSDKAVGTTSASFLKVPVGARAEAMGETGAASEGRMENLFWNPAGLAKLEEDRRPLAAGFSKLLEDAHRGYLATALPAWGGMLSTGLLYVSHDSLETFNTVGDSIGTLKPSDLAFSVGFSKPVSNYHFGGALKWIRQSLGDVSGSTFALDLGFRAPKALSLNDGPVDFAMAIQHLGPSLALGTTDDALPFQGLLGFLWKTHPRARFQLDARLPVDETPHAGLGVEVEPPLGNGAPFSLRAGYNLKNSRDLDGFTGFTGGFGLRLGAFQVDYAFVPFGDLGTTHRLSWAYFFGEKPRDRFSIY